MHLSAIQMLWMFCEQLVTCEKLHSLSFSVSFSHCRSRSRALSHYLSIPHSFTLFRTVSLSLSLSVLLSLSLSLSLSLPLCLALSLSWSRSCCCFSWHSLLCLPVFRTCLRACLLVCWLACLFLWCCFLSRFVSSGLAPRHPVYFFCPHC